MLELAHYEWVELALDVSTLEIPSDVALTGDALDEHPVVSPTAWRLSYQYPVHKIGPHYQPNADNVEPAKHSTYCLSQSRFKGWVYRIEPSDSKAARDT